MSTHQSLMLRDLLSISTANYALLNLRLAMYNPLLKKVGPPVIAVDGIFIPLGTSFVYKNELPKKYKNDVKHQIKKDGSERVEVTSHVIITEDNKSIHYDMPFRLRTFKGRTLSSKSDVEHTLLADNVHTLIEVTTVFTRSNTEVSDFYVANERDVTIYSRHPNMFALSN